jgi:hypothetical protein
MKAGLALLLGAAAVACGDDPTTTTTATRDAEERTVAFCDRWRDALLSEGDVDVESVLADVPTELEDAAAVIIAADPDGPMMPEQEAASQEFITWTELNCDQRPADSSQRYVGPPAGTEVPGLTFCGTTPQFPGTEPIGDDSGELVLYGDPSSGDPYAEPMLGLFRNINDEVDHRGDGDGRPVLVRGHEGTAAPITAFQQTVLPELGTVVAWSEDGRSYGLYGRGWPMSRADELVAIADGIEVTPEAAHIAAEALPSGYEEIVTGPQTAVSLLLPEALYSLRYEVDGPPVEGAGMVLLSGLQQSDAEFEAARFLTLGVEPGQLGDREVLEGEVWHDLSHLVTWREPDGLVVRILGLGADLETVEALGAAARELTPAEWAELVESEDTCTSP